MTATSIGALNDDLRTIRAGLTAAGVTFTEHDAGGGSWVIIETTRPDGSVVRITEAGTAGPGLLWQVETYAPGQDTNGEGDVEMVSALDVTAAATIPDPTPWVHVDGARVADPGAPDSPRGGYTFRPREGFTDYPDRYISTRHGYV